MLIWDLYCTVQDMSNTNLRVHQKTLSNPANAEKEISNEKKACMHKKKAKGIEVKALSILVKWKKISGIH